MGHGKRASKCSIMDGKGQRFTRDDLIDPFCICMIIKNGMEC
jgi:hypothetical protein